MAMIIGYDFCLTDWPIYFTGKRIRTASWTLSYFSQAISIYFFFACLHIIFFHIQVFLNTIGNFPFFIDVYCPFVITSHHLMIFSSLMSYLSIHFIDFTLYRLSGYLPVHMPVYSVYLPVHYTFLINIHSTAEILFWFTSIDKIPALLADFTLLFSLSEKFVNGAVMYLLTSVYILIWPLNWNLDFSIRSLYFGPYKNLCFKVTLLDLTLAFK